jgi:acetyl-CoA carboxylase biotin carboxyl carrier protein
MELTYRDVESILRIIDAAQHLDELELVLGGLRLHVVRNGAAGTIATSATPLAQAEARPLEPTSVASRAAKPEIPEGVVAVRAPMLGTFYRAPQPGAPAFVEEGQEVRADDTVCLIEVMKLFSSIRAGVDGRVARILAENGAAVALDEPLMFIAPSKVEPRR